MKRDPENFKINQAVFEKKIKGFFYWKVAGMEKDLSGIRKERRDVSIYKCGNDKCSYFLKSKIKLNFAERLLAKIKSSQFKLRYQYREYHFIQEELRYSASKEKILPVFL